MVAFIAAGCILCVLISTGKRSMFESRTGQFFARRDTERIQQDYRVLGTPQPKGQGIAEWNNC